MSDKIKHTVEIVAEMGADALVAFLKKCSTWSTEPKVIKSEKVPPPIKIGTVFAHKITGKEYTVRGMNERTDMYWVADTQQNMSTVTSAYLAGLERLDD